VQSLVVAKTSSYKTARDLNGKTIGVISLEGPAKIATQKFLAESGADVATIKFVEITPSNGAAEVVRGTIAAATINEPNLTPALDTVRELAYPFNSLGNVVQVSAWFAKDDWIKANPAAARAFAEAMKDTAIWADNAANYPLTGVILQKYDGFPAGFIKKMRRASYGERFDFATMQPSLDAAFDQKSLSAHVDAKSLVSAYSLVKE
jgi:NitT/TauT family transport system substrate-binding protein